MSGRVDMRAAISHLEHALSFLDERMACAQLLRIQTDAMKGGFGLVFVEKKSDARCEDQPAPTPDSGIWSELSIGWERFASKIESGQITTEEVKRSRNAEYCRVRREQLRANGLCTFCGKPSKNSLCESCRGRQSEQAKARYVPTGNPRGRRRLVAKPEGESYRAAVQKRCYSTYNEPPDVYCGAVPSIRCASASDVYCVACRRCMMTAGNARYDYRQCHICKVKVRFGRSTCQYVQGVEASQKKGSAE